MIPKTASLAFAAACLTAIAIVPAHAQTMGNYGSRPNTAPQTYQTNPAPNAPAGAYGSTAGAYAPQSNPDNAPANWSAGGYGSTTGNTAAPSYQGNMAPPPDTGMGGTQVMTNSPQTNPGDVSPNWSARRNVIESERYDRLLETNPGFRQARIRKECGPITDAQLRSDCLASFNQYEAPVASTGTTSRRIASSTRMHHYQGTSTAPRHHQSSSGQ